MSNHSRQALIHLLSGLHASLRQRFVTCHRSDGERSSLLLGLELLWKLEEQVVMPALQQAAPAKAPDVAQATQEIELMRNLSQRVESSGGTARQLALAALEGMFSLHCVASETLLVRIGSDAVDWSALHKEVQDLLARWRQEIRAHGEIEDEERDPVGLPPR